VDAPPTPPLPFVLVVEAPPVLVVLVDVSVLALVTGPVGGSSPAAQARSVDTSTSEGARSGAPEEDVMRAS